MLKKILICAIFCSSCISKTDKVAIKMPNSNINNLNTIKELIDTSKIYGTWLENTGGDAISRIKKDSIYLIGSQPIAYVINNDTLKIIHDKSHIVKFTIIKLDKDSLVVRNKYNVKIKYQRIGD